MQVPTTKPAEFPEDILDMLDILDIHLYHDQDLWGQICHLIRHKMKYSLYQIEQASNAAAQKTLEWVGSLLYSTTCMGLCVGRYWIF